MRYFALALVSFLLGYVLHMQVAKTQEDNIDVDVVVQQSIEQVSKLVVTEGHYSQVFTRRNSDSYLWDMIRFEKQAVILGMVDADVSYDLKKLKYRIDQKNKKIVLQKLPNSEIEYHYDFQWYDVEQSRLNQFDQKELNQIQEDAKKSVRSKVNEKQLRAQGEQRLIEELERMWSGLIALGWTIDNQAIQVNTSTPAI